MGLGPGSAEYLAPKAREALEQAEIIIGYKGYIGLLEKDLINRKEIISTGMTGEMQRCNAAIDKAMAGRRCAVVCSGDPGIYGMAGLILELLETRDPRIDLEVEIIPGIPALAAAAALLGAPLMHDFAVISLSDLLTPWEVIEKRIKAALEADFVLVLYNPRSKKRKWQLDRAMDMVIEHRGAKVPVGVVKNAMREGQDVWACPASELNVEGIDMVSIVLVGNSTTRLSMGKMLITPRGYLNKYDVPLSD